jgi:2-polyprenyl-6-methoxyphenol hydroxylase-like FAD-dependent oxidoreductase
MAIEDAAVLTRCLVQSQDHAAAFLQNEANRMPRVRRVQRIFAESSSVHHSADPT